MQQAREEREAKLLALSLPAQILAQKHIKYANVASTIKKHGIGSKDCHRKPQRLEKLSN